MEKDNTIFSKFGRFTVNIFTLHFYIEQNVSILNNCYSIYWFDTTLEKQTIEIKDKVNSLCWKFTAT